MYIIYILTNYSIYISGATSLMCQTLQDMYNTTLLMLILFVPNESITFFKNKEDYLLMMAQYGFLLLIENITRPPPRTCIDHIFI
jgi:hypothetical protein